jgi:hypothetical protein
LSTLWQRESDETILALPILAPDRSTTLDVDTTVVLLQQHHNYRSAWSNNHIMTETPFQSSIPEAVGESYDPINNDYVVVRHVQVGFKVLNGWKIAGEVEDVTAQQGSTMVVMEKPK